MSPPLCAHNATLKRHTQRHTHTHPPPSLYSIRPLHRRRLLLPRLSGYKSLKEAAALSQHVRHAIGDFVQLPLQLRLGTNGINQLIGPEMANLRHDRGDSTEHGPSKGHETIIDEILPPGAVAEAALHSLPQAGALHLVLARADAQLVVGLVEVEVEGEEEEADQAEGGIEAERPEEDGVHGNGGDVGGVDDGGEEGDGEMGGEEMGFVEAVEEDDEAHDGEGAALWAIDVFVDVGRSEVIEVGVVDPSGNAVRRAARGLALTENQMYLLHVLGCSR